MATPPTTTTAGLAAPLDTLLESPQPPAATPPSGLGRYFAFQLVSSMAFTHGIWVIYLHHRGLSLAEIGIAEAAYHLAPITLELPTGSFADVVGRKWSLVTGALLAAVAAGLMLAVDNVWLAVPALYLSGAAATFQSGAGEAFLYDSLAERDATGGFARVFGRLGSLSYLVLGATTWLGATLAGISFTWPYALAIAVGLAMAVLAGGLREPERERATHRGVIRHIRESLAIVHGRPRLAALLIFGSVVWTLVALLEIYAQAVLSEEGMSTAAIGLLIGGSFAPVAVGMWLAHRITARGSFRAWITGLIAVVIAGALGMGTGILPLMIATFILAELATGLFEPLWADRTNRDITTAQRATILSVSGFLFSLNMIWAFPLVGWLAGRAGWFTAYAAAGGLTALALGVWLVAEARAALTATIGET